MHIVFQILWSFSVMKTYISDSINFLAGILKKLFLVYTSCALILVCPIASANTNDDMSKLKRWLDQNKQYIYNKVYYIGTADSIDIKSMEKDHIDVVIQWTGWINKGYSTIRIELDKNDELKIYEVDIVRSSDPNSKENAQAISMWAGAGIALAGLLTALSNLVPEGQGQY